MEGHCLYPSQYELVNHKFIFHLIEEEIQTGNVDDPERLSGVPARPVVGVVGAVLLSPRPCACAQSADHQGAEACLLHLHGRRNNARKSASSFSNDMKLATVGKVCISHTERRKTKREEKEALAPPALAEEGSRGVNNSNGRTS